MEPKLLYTAADCIETGYDCSLQGKVIVLSRQALRSDYRNQLFFCSGGNGGTQPAAVLCRDIPDCLQGARMGGGESLPSCALFIGGLPARLFDNHERMGYMSKPSRRSILKLLCVVLPLIAAAVSIPQLIRRHKIRKYVVQ